jgi:hypothetical protein
LPSSCGAQTRPRPKDHLADLITASRHYRRSSWRLLWLRCSHSAQQETRAIRATIQQRKPLQDPHGSVSSLAPPGTRDALLRPGQSPTIERPGLRRAAHCNCRLRRQRPDLSGPENARSWFAPARASTQALEFRLDCGPRCASCKSPAHNSPFAAAHKCVRHRGKI